MLLYGNWMETKNTGWKPRIPDGNQLNTGWKPRILDGNQEYWMETKDTG